MVATQYELSDSDYERILKSTIIGSNIKRVKAEPTLQQIEDKKIEDKETERKLRHNAYKFEKERREKDNLDKDEIFRLTMGRESLLKNPNQTLFSESSCPYCLQKTMTVMNGWSGWHVGKPNNPIRGIHYNPENIDSNENYNVVHKCEKTLENLDRKCDYLTSELASLRTYVDRRIQEAAFAQAVGYGSLH